LATLLKSGAEMVAFQYGRELVAAIRQLLGSADLRRRISGAAWERCRAEHAPPARLKGLEAIASSCFTRGACQRLVSASTQVQTFFGSGKVLRVVRPITAQ